MKGIFERMLGRSQAKITRRAGKRRFRLKGWFFLFFILFFALFQATLLDLFRVLNLKPDLLLIVAFSAVFIFDARRGVLFAILSGLFKDIFSINTFGINTLLFFLWAVFVVELSKKIFLDNNYIRVLIVFIACFLNNIIIGLIFLFSGIGVSAGIFSRIIFLESAYTALIFPLIFRFIRPVFCPGALV